MLHEFFRCVRHIKLYRLHATIMRVIRIFDHFCRFWPVFSLMLSRGSRQRYCLIKVGMAKDMFLLTHMNISFWGGQEIHCQGALCTPESYRTHMSTLAKWQGVKTRGLSQKVFPSTNFTRLSSDIENFRARNNREASGKQRNVAPSLIHPCLRERFFVMFKYVFKQTVFRTVFCLDI